MSLSNINNSPNGFRLCTVCFCGKKDNAVNRGLSWSRFEKSFQFRCLVFEIAFTQLAALAYISWEVQFLGTTGARLPRVRSPGTLVLIASVIVHRFSLPRSLPEKLIEPQWVIDSAVEEPWPTRIVPSILLSNPKTVMNVHAPYILLQPLEIRSKCFSHETPAALNPLAITVVEHEFL